MNILHDKSSVKVPAQNGLTGAMPGKMSILSGSNMSTPRSSRRQTVRFAMLALMGRIVGSGRLPSQKML